MNDEFLRMNLGQTCIQHQMGVSGAPKEQKQCPVTEANCAALEGDIHCNRRANALLFEQ